VVLSFHSDLLLCEARHGKDKLLGAALRIGPLSNRVRARYGKVRAKIAVEVVVCVWANSDLGVDKQLVRLFVSS